MKVYITKKIPAVYTVEAAPEYLEAVERSIVDANVHVTETNTLLVRQPYGWSAFGRAHWTTDERVARARWLKSIEKQIETLKKRMRTLEESRFVPEPMQVKCS